MQCGASHRGRPRRRRTTRRLPLAGGVRPYPVRPYRSPCKLAGRRDQCGPWRRLGIPHSRRRPGFTGTAADRVWPPGELPGWNGWRIRCARRALQGSGNRRRRIHRPVGHGSRGINARGIVYCLELQRQGRVPERGSHPEPMGHLSVQRWPDLPGHR